MVVQTECMALISAGEKEQKASSHANAGNKLEATTTQPDYGSGPHNLQAIIDVSTPLSVSHRRMHSSQLLESRTLEDPAGTLMSGDDMPMISNLEVIDVSELQREAKNFGATQPIQNNSIIETSPVKIPQRILSDEYKAHKSKLIDILCDTIPQSSSRKGFSDLSDPLESIVSDKGSSTGPLDTENIAFSPQIIPDSFNETHSQTVAHNNSHKADYADDKINPNSEKTATSPVAVHVDSSSYENIPEIVYSKRRYSIGPVTQTHSFNSLTSLSMAHNNTTPAESTSESDRDVESLLKTVDDDQILHLDYNFTQRGSRVDFNTSAQTAVAQDFKGSISQVADIESFRYAFPTTSDHRVAVSDSIRHQEDLLSVLENDKLAKGTSFYDVRMSLIYFTVNFF